MEFDVGHGSVSRQQRVRPIRLHSPRVTLHRRLVLAFFKVSVSLKHTETVLSRSINHMMMMMMMMKSVSRRPSARLRAVSSAPHRSRSIPAPGTYRNSVEQLDQSHDDDDDDDDEERLTVSFCSTACCFLCSASLALDPST